MDVSRPSKQKLTEENHKYFLYLTNHMINISVSRISIEKKNKYFDS